MPLFNYVCMSDLYCSRDSSTNLQNPVYYLCFGSLTDSCTSTYYMYFSLSYIANPLILLEDTTQPDRGLGLGMRLELK